LRGEFGGIECDVFEATGICHKCQLQLVAVAKG